MSKIICLHKIEKSKDRQNLTWNIPCNLPHVAKNNLSQVVILDVVIHNVEVITKSRFKNTGQHVASFEINIPDSFLLIASNNKHTKIFEILRKPETNKNMHKVLKDKFQGNF